MSALEIFLFFSWCLWKYSNGMMDGLGDFLLTGFYFSMGAIIGHILFFFFGGK